MNEVGVLSEETVPSSQMPFPKLLYGRQEGADILSISVRTLDYLIANKQLSIS